MLLDTGNLCGRTGSLVISPYFGLAPVRLQFIFRNSLKTTNTTIADTRQVQQSPRVQIRPRNKNHLTLQADLDPKLLKGFKKGQRSRRRGRRYGDSTTQRVTNSRR